MRLRGGGGDQAGGAKASTTSAGDGATQAEQPTGPRGGPKRGRTHGLTDLHRLAREGALSLGGSIASSLLGFAITVVITRGIPPRSAGVLFEAIALFMILSNTAELGADTGLVRMVSMYRVQGRHGDLRPTIAIGLWPILIIASVFAGFVYAFAPQLASVFINHASQEEGIRIIRIMAVFLPVASATTAALSGTRGFGTMLPYVAVLGVGVPGLRPILAGLALLAGLGTVAMAVAWTFPIVIGFVVAAIALYVMLRRDEARYPGAAPTRSVGTLASDFWRFCIPRGVAAFLQAMTLWLSVLLVGALASSREAGIYAAANRFVGVGTLALQALGLALAPQVAELITKGDRPRANGLFQISTWWVMAVSWPIYLSLAVFAPFLLRIFGRQYVAGSAALVIMCLGLLVVVGTGNNKIVLLMSGGSGWNLVTVGIALVVNVSLSFVLIPHLGIVGAAIAFSIAVSLDTLITSVVIWKQLGVDPLGKGFALVVAACVLCFGVLGILFRLVLGVNAVSFLTFAVVSSLLYLGLLWWFRDSLRLHVLRDALTMRARRAAEAPVELT
jgi:O-antigen/teichoic acid export membrane protein